MSHKCHNKPDLRLEFCRHPTCFHFARRIYGLGMPWTMVLTKAKNDDDDDDDDDDDGGRWPVVCGVMGFNALKTSVPWGPGGAI